MSQAFLWVIFSSVSFLALKTHLWSDNINSRWQFDNLPGALNRVFNSSARASSQPDQSGKCFTSAREDGSRASDLAISVVMVSSSSRSMSSPSRMAITCLDSHFPSSSTGFSMVIIGPCSSMVGNWTPLASLGLLCQFDVHTYTQFNSGLSLPPPCCTKMPVCASVVPGLSWELFYNYFL